MNDTTCNIILKTRASSSVEHLVRIMVQPVSKLLADWLSVDIICTNRTNPRKRVTSSITECSIPVTCLASNPMCLNIRLFER